MKPTIGRIVHFNVVDKVALPAMVVAVREDACNLQVFQNGDGGLQFVKGVPFVDEPTEDGFKCYFPPKV